VKPRCGRGFALALAPARHSWPSRREGSLALPRDLQNPGSGQRTRWASTCCFSNVAAFHFVSFYLAAPPLSSYGASGRAPRLSGRLVLTPSAGVPSTLRLPRRVRLRSAGGGRRLTHARASAAAILAAGLCASDFVFSRRRPAMSARRSPRPLLAVASTCLLLPVARGALAPGTRLARAGWPGCVLFIVGVRPSPRLRSCFGGPSVDFASYFSPSVERHGRHRIIEASAREAALRPGRASPDVRRIKLCKVPPPIVQRRVWRASLGSPYDGRKT